MLLEVNSFTQRSSHEEEDFAEKKRKKGKGQLTMAAHIEDLFSLCVDSSKVRSFVEARVIDNVKGKGLFARKPIQKGDTIFVERPLVCAQFLWNALYKYRACDYCMRSLETAEENARRLSGNPSLLLPHPEQCKVCPGQHQACPQCQVMYCSTECREAALDQHHRTLCLGLSQEDPEHPVNKLQDAWRNMHFPPETSSIMLMSRMVSSVKQAKDKDKWLQLFSQFCSRTANQEEEIAHKLLGEKFQGQLALLRNLFTVAHFDDHLSRWFTPEGFLSLFSLVGTNSQGIGTSSLSQWVHGCDALELPRLQRKQLDAFIDQLYKDIDRETGDFLNCEGSGLFLLQSSCNHSCVPNAEASFPQNNFLLHLVALRDIEPGEEICICYLDCCQRERSRHSRHKILKENYLFVCGCPLCVSQAEDPDVTSEEDDDDCEGGGETEGDEVEDEMTDV